MAQYKRILLKLSGEMLGGEEGQGIDGKAAEMIAGEIAKVHKSGIQTGVVIGGGNIVRGAEAAKWGMERSSADYMGMLATVINALTLQGILESKFGVYTRVMTAISMQAVAEPYIRRRAIKHLETGRVVIFAGGTGNPLFTTDTAASLRAREIGADIVLKATKVDGVYDADPMTHPNAKRYTQLSYIEVLSKSLKVMDATAITMCMEAKLPILIFKMGVPGCVLHALKDHSVGSIVTS